jgi:hypothetical protein
MTDFNQNMKPLKLKLMIPTPHNAEPPIVDNDPALPVDDDPDIPAPEEPIVPQLVPTETVPPHNVHHSTRASKPPSQYIPSMEGNKYFYAATQPVTR